MITRSLRETLDQAHAQIIGQTSGAAEAVASIIDHLWQARGIQTPADWQQTIALCRNHPLCQVMLEDPLTWRSFTQPRGYAGDTSMLDLIYTKDWQGLVPAPTPVGREIFGHIIRCRAPEAVRVRRELLARKIDEIGTRLPAAHMLSVACGHLRELSLSSAFCAGLIGRFVGLDQDPISLANVRQSWPGPPVETIPGSIKLLFGGGLAREKFDFIYTAGLYDYLDDKFGRRLTRRMFDMLQPGGRLLVANFQPNVEDIGYMEAFMNWMLVYRDTAAMERLAQDIPVHEIAYRHTYSDLTDSIAFLELKRMSAS